MVFPEPLSSLALKSFGDLCTNLLEEYAKKLVGGGKEKIRHLRSNITPHIEATFTKCKTIKTLLNPHTPADFLSIYATQRFSLSEANFDHYGMVDYIQNKAKNLILTGTGGSGKSMFTKYLWLSLFVDGKGKIPLFVELRHINGLTTDDIILYLQKTVSIGPSVLEDSDYQKFLIDGDFIIIFDGFDEVFQDKKEAVQKQIISISEVYAKTK